MAQKYQQIEINKEEFKNLVTRKIDNFHEFSGINYSSDIKSDGPKQRNVSDKTPVKISEQLEKISPLDFQNNQD